MSHGTKNTKSYITFRLLHVTFIIFLHTGDVIKDAKGDGNIDGDIVDDDDDDDSDSDGVVVDDDDDDDDDDDNDQHYPDCSENMLTYTTELFLLDRSNVHSPNVVLTLPSVKLYYSMYTHHTCDFGNIDQM